MIYISAQPDTVYFHWQVELYLYQFSKHGIVDDCYALFGYTKEPSDYAIKLSKKYKGLKLYKDTREDKSYIPSIRPHILKKFFEEFPDLGKEVFYHDSDIFLVKMPDFKTLLNDDIGYVSDTISYIGYNYIHDSSKRYKEAYPELKEDDIFYGMTDIINIDPELVKANELNSGGAQYLLKNIDEGFFEQCELQCNTLHAFFKNYDKKYPIKNPIQSWTVDMWVVLWEYLKRGNIVRCHKELDFSWATNSVYEYYSKNIFHLAGVTTETSNDKFYKGQYTQKNIFIEYANNKSIFDHISKNNATYEYTNVIKEYCSSPGQVWTSIKKVDYNDTFTIRYNQTKSIYVKMHNIECCQRPVWKSTDNNLIIFWNTSLWIMTLADHINEISSKCSGGLNSSTGDTPYDHAWNFNYDYTIKCTENMPTIHIVTSALSITTEAELIAFINNVRDKFLPQYRKKFHISDFLSAFQYKDYDVNMEYDNTKVEVREPEYKLDINQYIPNTVIDSLLPYEYIGLSP